MIFKMVMIISVQLMNISQAKNTSEIDQTTGTILFQVSQKSTRIVIPANSINTTSLLKVAYYCIGTIGLIFNGFVAFVLMFVDKKINELNNTSAFHIKCQTCIDALVAIFLLATTLKEDNEETYTPGYFWDEILCRVWFSKILLWISLVSSTYSVVALNLDRFIAIIYPIFHKAKFSQKRKYSIILIICCTAVGPVYNFAYVIPTSGIKEDKRCYVYSIFRKRYLRTLVGILTLFIQFFIPLILIIILHLKMFITLQTKVTPRQNYRNSVEANNEESHISTVEKVSTQTSRSLNNVATGNIKIRAKAKLLKTVGMLSMSFIFCWSFNQFYFLMYQINFGNLYLSGPLYHVTVIMVFSTCCVNPFVYSIKFEPFQRKLKFMAIKIKNKLLCFCR